MSRPNPIEYAAELNETVLKAALRDAKTSLAFHSSRPLTADEERTLQMGIIAGSNAMLQELVRRDLFRNPPETTEEHS